MRFTRAKGDDHRELLSTLFGFFVRGQIQADFVTNLVAGQNVDLTLKFPILGANVPNTNCGVMLQSFTLGGATLTRVN